MKRNGITILGLVTIMALVVVGCTPITQANAKDAAAVVGLGSADSYNTGTSRSILAQTVIDNKNAIIEAQEKSLSTTVSFSASYGGGTVTFTNYAASTNFPDSSQDSSFIALSYWSVTYSNVKVTYNNEEYKLNGTVYMRFALSGLSFNFVLTGDVKISGAIDDTASIDVIFKASTSGYTFTGTVNDYQVSSNFTLS